MAPNDQSGDQEVTPWAVAGKDGGAIDYDKLIVQFGCQRLDSALMERAPMDKVRDFRQFMACVTSVEDLHKRSSRSLADFQQHLETFQRVPLSRISGVISEVAAVAPSARLTMYLKVGSLLEDPARLVVAKLDSTLKALWAYIKQAQALLVALESFVRSDDDNLMQSKLSTKLEVLEISTYEIESEENLDALHQSTKWRCTEKSLQTSDYAHMMLLIWTMLVEEFEMQERIMTTLGLDTTAEALQTYSLMWMLRPFVDDAVVEQAISWIGNY